MFYMLSMSDVLLIGMMHAHVVLHSRIVGSVVRVVDLWCVIGLQSCYLLDHFVLLTVVTTMSSFHCYRSIVNAIWCDRQH